MKLLRQGTVRIVKVGPFVDDADGWTPETALSIAQADVRIAKADGAFAQKASGTTIPHAEGGWYNLTLTAVDTDTLGLITISIKKGGALHVVWEGMVIKAEVFDAMVPGTVAFRANPWGEVRASNNAAGTFGEAVAAVAGNVGGTVDSVVGGVGFVAPNGIRPDSMQDASIRPGVMAAGAIDAPTLTFDAQETIRTGLATMSALAAVAGGIIDLSGRIPAALVGARMDVRVGAMADNVIATNTLSTGAKTAIATEASQRVWNALRANHNIAGSFGQAVAGVIGNVTGSVGSVAGEVASIAAGGIDAAAFTLNAGRKLADIFLRRPLGTAAASADGDAHPALNARNALAGFRRLTNRSKRTGNRVAYMAENDTTAVAEATVVPAGAAPISDVDPD